MTRHENKCNERHAVICWFMCGAVGDMIPETSSCSEQQILYVINILNK